MFFFFNDTATTEIYTLSLHDALPICQLVALHLFLADRQQRHARPARPEVRPVIDFAHDGKLLEMLGPRVALLRSEEHTSELQSPDHLVCRLLLEKKKNQTT